MEHHAVADIDTHMAHARRVIGALEKHQITGPRVRGGNRGADVVKARRAQPADVPAAVIDDPRHKAGAVETQIFCDAQFFDETRK